MEYITLILALSALSLAVVGAWRSNTDNLTDYSLYGMDAEEYLKEQVGEELYNKNYKMNKRKIKLPKEYESVEIKENWVIAESKGVVIKVMELPESKNAWWVEGYYFNGECFEVFLTDSEGWFNTHLNS